jgi:hypothetical protein
MSLEQALQQQEAFRLKKVWAGRKRLIKEAIQRLDFYIIFIYFYCVLRCICFIELKISAAKLHVGRQFSRPI